MIRPYIKKGVAGKAVPIVLLSEGSHVDRAIFNCIAHILYDRPCETSEEIDRVWSIQMQREKEIIAFLKKLPAVEEEPNRKFELAEY